MFLEEGYGTGDVLEDELGSSEYDVAVDVQTGGGESQSALSGASGTHLTGTGLWLWL